MPPSTPRLGNAPEAFVAALGRPELGRPVDGGFVLRFTVNERDLTVLFLRGVAAALHCGPTSSPDPALPPLPRDFIGGDRTTDHQVFIPRPNGNWLLSIRGCTPEQLNGLESGAFL